MNDIPNEHNFVPGKLVVPENTLKQKVGTGGFTEAVLTKAQQGLDKNEIDFRPMAFEYLEQLDEIFSKMASGEIKNEEMLDAVMFPVMQLRAQGSLFKYPSVTKISHVLIDCLETVTNFDKNVVDLVQAYKKSTKALLTLQIKEDTHKTTKELCTALFDACGRYEKVKTS
jgi:hypothetical protein